MSANLPKAGFTLAKIAVGGAILVGLGMATMGERIEAGEWFTYIPIWFAVLLLIIEGVLHLYKQQQNKKQLERNIEHFEKQQHSD